MRPFSSKNFSEDNMYLKSLVFKIFNFDREIGEIKHCATEQWALPTNHFSDDEVIMR